MSYYYIHYIYTNVSVQGQECRCGAKECRGIIGGKNFLITAISEGSDREASSPQPSDSSDPESRKLLVQEQISSAGSGLMEVRVRLPRMKPDSFTPVSQVPVKRGRKSSGSVKSQEAEKRKMSSPQSTPSKAKKMIQENVLNVSTASKPKIFSNLLQSVKQGAARETVVQESRPRKDGL